MKRSRMDEALHGSELPQLSNQVQPLQEKLSPVMEYLAEVKTAFKDTWEKYEKYQKVMKNLKTRMIDRDETVTRLMILFDGHPELIVGLNAFMPHENIDTEEATLELIRKIKRRFLDDRPACQLLVKKLNMLIEGDEFDYDRKLDVATLLQGHPYLLVDFLHVLSTCDDSASMSDEQSTSVENVKSQEVNSAAALAMQQPCIDDRKIIDTVAEKLSHGDSDHGDGDTDCLPLTGASAYGYVDAGEKVSPSQSQSEDENMATHVQELDLSKFEKCGPSYRLLPKDTPTAISSWKNEIGLQVLNDHCISFIAQIENYSIKHRNPYEEKLFRCEDDMYELDMLIESVNETTQHFQTLLEPINNQVTEANCSISIRDYLKPRDLRCIENMYGEHGVDVVHRLRKNPVAALPVILGRLKQKQDELGEYCHGFNEVCAQAFEDNYHKSLDYSRLGLEGVVSQQ